MEQPLRPPPKRKRNWSFPAPLKTYTKNLAPPDNRSLTSFARLLVQKVRTDPLLQLQLCNLTGLTSRVLRRA
jgi:hypothetical protein